MSLFWYQIGVSLEVGIDFLGHLVHARLKIFFKYIRINPFVCCFSVKQIVGVDTTCDHIGVNSKSNKSGHNYCIMLKIL